MVSVNVHRMLERIEQLAHITVGSSRGVTRFPFTKEMDVALELVAEWMRSAGMNVYRDSVDNLIGTTPCTVPDAPSIMLGSHIDSVPEGGKFDGVLGVVAAIEVVTCLQEAGLFPTRPIEVVAFCDEEGARFHQGLLGSRAMVGMLSEKDLALSDDAGITVWQAMTDYDLNPSEFKRAQRRPSSIHTYLEMHIEQGPVLQSEQLPCGLVKGIFGADRYLFKIHGAAGHAGTVPMPLRRDALSGAAQLISLLETLVLEREEVVATVGKLSVHPGASNVIPGRVEGTIDIRGMDDAIRGQIIQELIFQWEQAHGRRNLQLELELVSTASAVTCSPRVNQRLKEVLARHHLPSLELSSGAGHDAMILGQFCEAGMLFVRCRDGVSHHPDEFASAEDIEVATQLLFELVSEFAQE